MGGWGLGGWERERNIELLRKLLDYVVVELRPGSLLEHGKRRLLAADFGRKLALGQPRLAARQPNLFAELWIKVFHCGGIMDFILSTIKGSNINIINSNINNVHNIVNIVD